MVDDSTIPVGGIGIMTPNSFVSLSSILFVHGFSFNLISISKLTKNLHCYATYLPNFVVI